MAVGPRHLALLGGWLRCPLHPRAPSRLGWTFCTLQKSPLPALSPLTPPFAPSSHKIPTSVQWEGTALSSDLRLNTPGGRGKTNGPGVKDMGSSPGSATNPRTTLSKTHSHPFSLSFLFCNTGVIDPPYSHPGWETALSALRCCTCGLWMGRRHWKQCPQHPLVSVKSHNQQTPELDSLALGPGSPRSGSDFR